MKKQLFLIIAVMSVHWSLLPSRIHHAVTITPMQKKQTESTSSPDRITIWVHGARTLGFISDRIHACPPGLHKASDLETKHRLRAITWALAEAAPCQFPLETFYTFGWSGALSFEDRKEAAQKLYAAMGDLDTNFRQTYHRAPKIQLISHSHGGNVVLNIAAVKDPHSPITIDRAILMACPVQEETKQFIHDPIFNHVDVIYSSGDITQVLDPQGLYKNARGKKGHPTFSARHFPAQSHVYQANISIDGHRLGHISFVRAPFITKLPSLLTAMEKLESTTIGAMTSDDECMLDVTCEREKHA